MRAGLLASHLKATFKHLLCLEYSTVAIQNRAMEDFLAGPDHIFSILESALPDIRAMRQQFPDAVVLPGATALPPASDLQAQEDRRSRSSKPAIVVNLARGVVNQLRQHDPETHHPAADQRGHPGRPLVLAQCRVDGVTVTTADGRGVVYRQRDRAKMFALLRASLRQQLRVVRQFDRMRKVYREALPVLTSTQKWETVLLTESAEKN